MELEPCTTCGTFRRTDQACPACGAAAVATPPPVAPPSAAQQPLVPVVARQDPTAPGGAGSAGDPIGSQQPSAPTQPAAPPPQRSGRRSRAWIGIVAAIVVVAALVGGLVVGRSMGSDGAADEADRPTSEPSPAADPEPADDASVIDDAPSDGDESSGDVVELDGYLQIDDEGVAVVSPDGEATTIVGHRVATAFDDGAGGLVFQEERLTEQGPSSDLWSLATASPTNDAEGTIWHLPAGAAEAEAVVAANGVDGTFPGLAGAGRLGDRSVVVYASTTFDPTASEDQQVVGDLVLRDLETGDEEVLEEWAWGYESYVGAVEILPDRLAYTLEGEGMVSWVVRDADLNVVDTPCSEWIESYSEPGCGSGAVADDGRTVTLQPSETYESIGELSISNLDDGQASAPLRNFTSPYLGEGGATLLLDAQGHEVIFSSRERPYSSTEDAPAQLLDLDAPDRDAIELPARGWVRFLQAPLVRPAGDPASTYDRFAGSWTAHSTSLEVYVDGFVTYSFRDYSQPGMVTPTITMRATGVDGDAMQAEVVTADAGAGVVPGDAIELRLGEPGLLLSGAVEAQLCDEEHQMRGDCGA